MKRWTLVSSDRIYKSGYVLINALPAPPNADFFENQHAEGRATIPAPPFWVGMLHDPEIG
jgi:hypothetical protein